MITAPTPSFYLLKIEGEAAKSVADEISPAAASDISLVVFTSVDFEVDIAAINSLDTATAHVRSIALLGDEFKVEERYNPLYIPSEIEKLDEMLNLDPRQDGVRFVGMNGNPYTLKIIEGTINSEPIVSARVDYRPFDMPGYSEIIADRETTLLN